MKRSAPRITVTLLRQFDACDSGIDAFREAFPRGLTVATTGPGRARQAARAASAGLDIGWAAETLLDAVARAAYREAIAVAGAAYDEAIAPALAAYDEAIAVAWAAYQEANAVAGAAYDEAIAVAFLDAFHNQHNR